MDDGPVRYLLAFVLLFLLAGFFAGSETALASVNKIRMGNKADDGDRAAKRVMYILEHFDKALTTLLIGNNVVHATIATLATVFTYGLFDSIEAMPDYAVTLCTLITTVIVFFVGEMIPKCFAKACNESFARTVARPLILLMKVLTPVSFVFSAISRLASKPFRKKADSTPTVTEDELYDIIETYVEENDIDDDTGELVQNAIEFSRSTVRDVMTPWDKVVKVSKKTTPDETAEIIRSCTYSRLPVTDDDGNIAGTLSVRAFLKKYIKDGTADITKIMSPPEFIPSTVPVDDLLSTLSGKRTHIAYVRAGNKVIGLITIEDILEELVGEIYDEKEKLGGDNDA